MDIPINTVFSALGSLSVPVVAYLGFVHRRIASLDNRISGNEVDLPEKYVAKEDYKDDMRDIKSLVQEVRADVKELIYSRHMGSGNA